MDVHILVAVFGEDPPECEVLGVFSEYNDALALETEIVKRTQDYWRECFDVGNKFVNQLTEWKNGLQRFYKTDDRSKRDLWHYFRYDSNLDKYEIGRGYSGAIQSFEIMKDCVQKLGDEIDFAPLPELPTPILWQHPHGQHSAYEMQIITKEVQEKNSSDAQVN